jgi:hypothetical protein
MVVSNMASSVLQLLSVFGGVAVDGRTLATPVPAGDSRLFCGASRAPVLVAVVALCGVLHAGSMPCCAAATELYAAATQSAGSERDCPSEAVALAAFLRARAWLDADALPAQSEQAAQLELADTAAVCVILRHAGRVVGYGEDAGEGGVADGLMLRRAVGRAVARALGDETIRNVRELVGDRVTVRLSLELELAGAARPLLGRTIAEAAARVVPGRDGLAVRRGESIVRAFPSRLCAADIAARPDRTVTALLIDAGLPAKDLNQYATEDRVSVARFASVRLRQDAPEDAPLPVTRAGRTIAPAEVTPAAARVLAMQLAARLAAQVVAAEESGAASAGVRLLGTLNPTADAYDPPFADTRQTATAALALAHAARSEVLPEALRDSARRAASGLVGTLLERPDADRGDFVDAVCAIALARLGANGSTPVSAAARAALAERMRLALTRVDTASGAPNAPQAALTAAAALAILDDADAATRAARVTRSLVGTLDAKPTGVLQASLPLALLASSERLDDASRAELRRLLTTVALQLMPQQVGADPELSRDVPADLVGGLLPPTGPRSRVEADCLLHAAAFGLAFPGGSDGAPDGLGTMLHGFVRFTAQLTASDPWVGGFRRPEQIRGLVRGSLASDDCPPEPTALGLLAVLSALETGLPLVPRDVARDVSRDAPLPPATPER